MKQYFSFVFMCMNKRDPLPVMLLVGLLMCSVTAKAQSADLLVLYPNVRAPFSKIYQDISEGAEEQFEGGASSVMLGNDEVVDSVLARKKPDVVLALGRRSLARLESSGVQTPIVLGAVNEHNKSYPGISMVPDPKVIIDKLVLLSPLVNRVHVVRKSNGLAVQLDGAKEYLESLGKTLSVHESSNIRDAANIYAKLVDEAQEGDAVWILQDGSFVNGAILSVLLDAAWSKHLVVFSSNPLHVKHGALFAVYPDNRNMGASLAKLANRVVNGEVIAGLNPLQDVLVAVNERTGNHLGVALSKEVKENVDLLLPAR